MKKLLNTLYAMSEDIYLSLDGETQSRTGISRSLPAIRCTRCKA